MTGAFAVGGAAGVAAAGNGCIHSPYLVYAEDSAGTRRSQPADADDVGCRTGSPLARSAAATALRREPSSPSSPWPKPRAFEPGPGQDPPASCPGTSTSTTRELPDQTLHNPPGIGTTGRHGTRSG